MLLEAQLAALRWAVKAKAEAFMDSVRQAIAGAPDGRDGSRHRQTAEMPWPEIGKSERIESHYVCRTGRATSQTLSNIRRVSSGNVCLITSNCV